LEKAIKRCDGPNGPDIPAVKYHEKVKSLYSWHMVSERCEKVYDKVMVMPRNNLVNRIKMSMTMGPFAGLGQILFFLLDLHLLIFLDFFWPRESIELAETFDVNKYLESKNTTEEFSDHEFDPRKV
jgi:phosphatidylinositol glycan class A protein